MQQAEPSGVEAERLGGLGDWEHQARAIAFTADKEAACLAMEMGTGKSRVAVRLCDLWNLDLVLIVCPLSVTKVWPNQYAQHSSRTWEVCSVAGDAASPSNRTQWARRAIDLARARKRPCAIAINFESAWREPFASWALTAGFQLVLVDESHRAKDPEGKLSSWLSLWSTTRVKPIPKRLALTGTLLPHSPLDVFAQYRFLEPQIFGRNFLAFRAHYAEMKQEPFKPTRAEMQVPRIAELEHPDPAVARQQRVALAKQIVDLSRKERCHPRFPGWVMQLALEDDFAKRAQALDGMPRRTYQKIAEFKNLDALNAKIYQIAFRVTKDEALDLPEEIFETRPVTLDGEARRLYDQFEEDFYAKVTSGEITANNALTHLVRLHQISSGHVCTDDGQLRRVGDHKALVLKDILQDVPAGQKVVVFCRFTDDVMRGIDVCNTLDLKWGQLADGRSDLTDEGKFPPDRDVMLVNIQSGGVGVDFCAASLAIYYSIGFSLADYDQSRSRLHRPGQVNKVTYLHLVAESTVEPAIYGALRKRTDLIQAVLERRP